MITLNGRSLLIGGFHDHWWRADTENPALLFAALNYYHYDFVTLMDGPESSEQIRKSAVAYTKRFKIYAGREEDFGWGHIVTVQPRAAKLNSSLADYEQVIRQLKGTCDLVFLAHPPYPTTWEPIFLSGEIDRLIDEGIVDGTQMTVGPGERDQKLIDWYRQRDAAGKLTPIVGGWDAHSVAPVGKLPPALYTAERDPRGHIDTAGSDRTILFAEENSFPAIYEAVKAGRTVVESLLTGELVGPAALVDFLEKNGYREEMARRDARRNAVTLTVEKPWIVGEDGMFSVSEHGALRLPKSFTESYAAQAEAGIPVTIPRLPALVERDTYYLPVFWTGDDGTERVWAVETTHPIQFEILPWMLDGGPAVEFLPKLPFDGEITIAVDGLLPETTRTVNGRTLIPLDPALITPLPFTYRIITRSTTGVTRSQTGFLSFVGVHRFTGDWSAIPTVGVDRPQFVPEAAFGRARPWPGPDVFSAQMQFAWTDDDFLFRARVRDDIHYQPTYGHFMYSGDSLQLALDIMLRRREILGNVYAFNMALTEQGPELFRWHSPLEEASEDFTPPTANVTLGGKYLSVEPVEGGLLYTMHLPWSELGPLTPAPGKRMGVYFIMFNNNGTGHLDTLHWPMPIPGMWTIPNRWGVLSLLP